MVHNGYQEFLLEHPDGEKGISPPKNFDMPEDVIEHYCLREKALADGFVYVAVSKGMYGLPQAGIIAQQLLEERLGKEGYSQSKFTPGLWSHECRPVQFSLVVDDFGVK